MKLANSALVLLSIIGVTFSPGFSFAQSPFGLAGPNHPPGVPPEYVITPFGYFHPSCVLRLAAGERLLPDGRVQHRDGAVDESAAACSYPRYTTAGLPMIEHAPSPVINEWVESANMTTGSTSQSYGTLLASWRVPPQPPSNDGQTLFYFPGLEDINNTQSILQPVLAWYGGQWTIASWNCCLSGVIHESAPVNVNPGDLIYGSITNSCSPGTDSCATWNVLSVDLATGQSTILAETPSDGQIFNWAFGGVLEAYNVATCNDYPRDRRIVFDHIEVFDQYLRRISILNWSDASNSTAQPQCGYGVEAYDRTVKLSY